LAPFHLDPLITSFGSKACFVASPSEGKSINSWVVQRERNWNTSGFICRHTQFSQTNTPHVHTSNMSVNQGRTLTLNAEDSSFGPMESLFSIEPSVLNPGSTLDQLDISVGDTGADISLSIKDGSVVFDSKCDEDLTRALIEQAVGASQAQRKILTDASRAIYKHRRAEQAKVVAERMAAEAEQEKKVLDRYNSLGSQSIALDEAVQPIYDTLSKSPHFPMKSSGSIMRMIQVCIDLGVPVRMRYLYLI
jgi:hypothetical protein